MIITVKIDVTKVDKARLFEGKNGAKYLDITLLGRDEPDQYGNDFMVVQQVSQQERQSGVKGTILGNGKILGRKGGVSKPVPSGDLPPETDDVPF
jgi:hypothetical protein